MGVEIATQNEKRNDQESQLLMHWCSDSICSKIEEKGSDLKIIKIYIFDKLVFIDFFKG